MISFQRDKELHVLEIASKKERRLTSAAPPRSGMRAWTGYIRRNSASAQLTGGHLTRPVSLFLQFDSRQRVDLPARESARVESGP
jgi:hypothetical protein